MRTPRSTVLAAPGRRVGDGARRRPVDRELSRRGRWRGTSPLPRTGAPADQGRTPAPACFRYSEGRPLGAAGTHAFLDRPAEAEGAGVVRAAHRSWGEGGARPAACLRSVLQGR